MRALDDTGRPPSPIEDGWMVALPAVDATWDLLGAHPEDNNVDIVHVTALSLSVPPAPDGFDSRHLHLVDSGGCRRVRWGPLVDGVNSVADLQAEGPATAPRMMGLRLA